MTSSPAVNVLLVDDQPAKLLSYEAILGDLPVQLLKASSGRQALEHLLKTDIAVVLVDVCMPDLDGFELASLIRQHPRCEKTAIILVSAVNVSDLDRLKGYGSGAVDYVPVPIIPEVLRAKVNVFVDLYCKTRELQLLNRELEKRVAERTADLEAAAARLRASEEQLKETDRRKDEFLAMLSHELRNPLAPIRNAVAILSLLGSSDPHVAQARDIVDRQVAHLTRLVDDLLDASRLTRGHIALKCESLSLADVVEGALEAARPIIEHHEHSLSVQFPDAPILVHGDRTRLIQVVTNLLTNAAKFTSKGGYVTVTVEHRGSRGVIRVRDTGIGVIKEAQGRIFELFAQEETTLARSQGGLGIGLTLVKQIVELHGGQVEVESEGLGKGTELRILLPALAVPVLLERDGKGDHVPHQPNQLRILVVDDNVDSAESFKTLLELSGHHVVTVHDGLVALRVVDELDPHVAFVDLGLPGLDGFEVARRILQYRPKPPVLVALSGYGREEDKERTKAVGFHHHLVKPVDYGAVLAYLATLGAATMAQERSSLVH
jgi:signal transduction histidine kinase